MNIFALHKCPIISAQMCCDKHVVKMILESAQLLSTAIRVLDGVKTEYENNNRRKTKWVLSDPNKEALLYKAGWINHPSTQWVMSNRNHYLWLLKHFEALNAEFLRRYHNSNPEKSHVSFKKLNAILQEPPKNIPVLNVDTLPTPAVPDECLVYDENNNIMVVDTYRKYYIMHKHHIASWKYPSKAPDWYQKT